MATSGRVSGIAVAALVAAGAVPGTTATPVGAEPAGPETRQNQECIKGGGGFLRVSLSGAYAFEVDWPNEGTICHGAGTAYAVGVNFGRNLDEGKTLTVGFTIKELAEGETAEGLPVDVSIGGGAVDDDMFRAPSGSCSVDIVEHERVEETPAGGVYRVTGRGSCDAPAPAMVGSGSLEIGEFEFSGTTGWSG